MTSTTPDNKIKDYIAPSSLKISSNYLELGDKFVRTLFIFTYPRYLQTSWFSPIMNLDLATDISIFIHPTETHIILKNLKKSATRFASQVSIEKEKGKIRDPVLETAYQDIEQLRDKLQRGTDRFFKFGLYITIYAESLEKLDKKTEQIANLLESRLVQSKPAHFQMETGFDSSLPLGQDKLLINTAMDSGPVSATFPFSSADLTSNKGILYGINRHNNSLILFDRFDMENANQVVFGKAGAGKSYAIKTEILRSMMLGTEVIVIDPENEYKYLAETVGGSFINISLTSPHHINPFDLPKPRKDESPADVLRTNIINLVGLLRIMLGGKTPETQITPEEDAIIDKALTETYAIKDITPQSDFSKIDVPLMSDLHAVLEGMEGAESLVTRLEKYTKGSFSGFMNNPTNVKINKQLVVFSIRDMEDELRPLAMFMIMHYIWNLVRSKLKKRVLIVDEAWWMMRHEDAASFMFGIAKRARKYYLGLTTITQDIEDFLKSPYGKPIITNSSIQLLMKQSPAAIDILAKTFYLTDEEKFLLMETNVGEGIFFAGPKHVAIKVIASYTEDQVITSDPEQLLEIEKAKKELAEENKNAQ